MADSLDTNKKSINKSPHALREESVLSAWQEKDIFNKTLAKDSPKGEFVFFEGPPTANGRPGIHHLEARAFKDAIPRYKTMQGFHVRRKGGWDTHGLPVELQVEKELGLKSKKEIEVYGVGPFNEKCKESVWKYVHEWEDFTKRMGYWVDLKDPYITYKPDYIEAIWNVIKTVDDQKLLYKDYKVVPWCPRCGTGLSSHELAQGYEEVKDLSLYVKFKVTPGQKICNSVVDENTYLLAWTTTPWTLPGNVGLAVGEKVKYVKFYKKDEPTVFYVSSEDHFNKLNPSNLDLHSSEYPATNIKALDSALANSPFEYLGAFTGKDLVGTSYEPLFPFLKDNVSGAEKEKLTNAFKVYAADFVTTVDGTGIVHIAPMYGQDDFELGTKVGLPKHHLVNDDGTFKKETGFLAGIFVKEKDEKGKPTLDVDIVNYLKENNNFFAQENYKHTYPHCWRCHTPLIYFARDSWYIQMSKLRDKLVKENESINWEPSHIKEGRFGEWLREVKDWAISRERYWGTPLPIWSCDSCKKIRVVGSVAEIAQKPKNTYFMMRHAEAEHNVLDQLNSDQSKPFKLTEKGREQVRISAESLKVKIDLIYTSPLLRTRETSEIVAQTIGLPVTSIIIDNRLCEIDMGELEGKPVEEYTKLFPLQQDIFYKESKGVESRLSIKKRGGDFINEIEKNNSGKTILVVGHDAPLWMLSAAAQSCNVQDSLDLKPKGTFFLANAEIRPLNFSILPHNAEYELDLHKPFIDDVKLACHCGAEMVRAKEVMDVWFDSGSMPFAQDHGIEKGQGASEKGKGILSKLFGSKEKIAYPADFISEAIDQTRGWFYTLHAIGTLMGTGKAYKNVICLGHILDAEGKKMSKSIGNVVNPWDMMDLYGADALRFWMYSVNQPGDSKNFDQKTVDEVVKKVFNLASNVLSFYKMYEDKLKVKSEKVKVGSQNVIDQWIVARLNQLVEEATKGLNSYKFFEPTRAIRDFIADLSQWYLRRSRDRFKGDDMADKEAALATTKYVLLTLAKVMAPFTPFFAEYLYGEVGGELESVHLEEWPKAGKVDENLLINMDSLKQVIEVSLALRSNKKVPVRQPLSELRYQFTVKREDIPKNMLYLIGDEVNVKSLKSDVIMENAAASIIDKDGWSFIDSGGVKVALNFTSTPALKEEGDLRELIRKIQDTRKEKGLSVGDKASLVVPADLKMLATKYENEIKKSAGLLSVEIGDEFKLKM